MDLEDRLEELRGLAIKWLDAGVSPENIVLTFLHALAETAAINGSIFTDCIRQEDFHPVENKG